MIHFSDTLKASNVERITHLIETMLLNKTYAFTTCHEYNDYKLKCHPEQHLKDILFWIDTSVAMPESLIFGFSASDTYGIWGLSSYTGDKHPPHITITDSYIRFNQLSNERTILRSLITPYEHAEP